MHIRWKSAEQLDIEVQGDDKCWRVLMVDGGEVWRCVTGDSEDRAQPLRRWSRGYEQ